MVHGHRATTLSIVPVAYYVRRISLLNYQYRSSFLLLNSYLYTLSRKLSSTLRVYILRSHLNNIMMDGFELLSEVS
jgi:hypothetical protein